jgi:hypothetical protein
MFNFLFIKIGITAIITKFINKLLEMFVKPAAAEKKGKTFLLQKAFNYEFPGFHPKARKSVWLKIYCITAK